ncbi:MAG: bifunctional diguanylate cyclase/phosphodiesterase [Propylenella sp.]
MSGSTTKFGIRGRIILLALVCAVLPSALISVLAIRSSRDALERGVRLELSGLASEQMSRLTASIERATTDLGTWAALSTMQNALIDDVDGVIQSELVDLQKRYPTFGELLVLNSSGIVIASTLDRNKGLSLGDRTYFTLSRLGKPFWGDVGKQEVTNHLGMLVTEPIRADYDESTIIGVLVGIIDWPRVQDALRDVRVWGAPQDSNHRLILASDTAEPLFETLAERHVPSERLPIGTGVRAVDIDGQHFLVGTKVVKTAVASPFSDWALHAMVARDIAYRPIALLRNRIALLSVGILAAAMLFGAFASSRWIVNPIKRVTNLMREVSQGNVDLNLSGSHRRDEVGEMVRSIAAFRANLLEQNRILSEREQALNVQNTRFDAALTNMSQGLAMFDADGRLVVCNRRFAEIYHLPRELSGSGAGVEEISNYVASMRGFDDTSVFRPHDNFGTGISGTVFLSLNDGRTIAIQHQLMARAGWVSTHEDITERRNAEAKIVHMARHDALTNLPNRTMFRAEIEDALKRTQRGESVAVLCLDLDYFKSVNDTLGHPIGDALLCAVADRLRGCLREDDIVARLGGDEFALVQFGTDQPTDSTILAQRVIDTLSAPYEIYGHQIVIGASVGIAIAPADGNDPDQIIKNADMALYRAKADGRGRYRFFEPDMDAKMQARRKLEIDLRRALVSDEFELHYQPLVNVNTNEITGFEALIRWHHPERGIVSPADFIPLCEEIGLIVPLGEWVLNQACRDATSWPSPVRVAVNLSPNQFKSPDLTQSVFRALAKSKLAPQRLELEITETVLLQDSEATLATLHQLRNMGVRISMDDFGTGYSSLSYLRSFPFDKIKIDQSFIRDLGSRDDSVVIVRAVTTIGNSLGISTTAEGVEDSSQLERLRDEGCTEVQGFYLGKPVPITETMAFLDNDARGSARRKLVS